VRSNKVSFYRRRI